jgi:hypothetical protein
MFDHLNISTWDIFIYSSFSFSFEYSKIHFLVAISVSIRHIVSNIMTAPFVAIWTTGDIMPEILMAISSEAVYQDWDLRLMQNKFAMNIRMKKYDILINNLSKMLFSFNNLYMNLLFQSIRFAEARIDNSFELIDALFLWCFNALCLVNCRSISSQDDSSMRSHFVNRFHDKSHQSLNVLDNLSVNWLAQGINALGLSTQQNSESLQRPHWSW